MTEERYFPGQTDEDSLLVTEDGRALYPSDTEDTIIKAATAFDNGDGISLGMFVCPTHGKTPQVVIYNQGGYDNVHVCTRCALNFVEILGEYQPKVQPDHIFYREDE